MKILKITVDELPETCLDCTNLHCHLPLARSKTQATDKVLKKYKTQRHENCILEIEKCETKKLEQLCMHCGRSMVTDEDGLWCSKYQKIVME